MAQAKKIVPYPYPLKTVQTVQPKKNLCQLCNKIALGNFKRGLKWKLLKYLSTKWNWIDSNFVAGLVRETIILIFPQNMTVIQGTVWGQEIVVHLFTDFSQRWKLSNTRSNLRAMWWIYTQETCMQCCKFPEVCTYRGYFTLPMIIK